MAETKDEIAAQRDALRVENAQLRAQLSRAGGGAYRPEQQFVLGEGQREELARTGMVNIGGKLLTREDVQAKLSANQASVDLGDATPDAATLSAHARNRGAVLGVDFVYPSVEPGGIDPAVAGTPGINGPAADVSRETTDDVSRETTDGEDLTGH